MAARRFINCIGVKATDILRRHRVWIDLEMRGNDTLTNSPGLYDTTMPDFAAYLRAWLYLARAYKDTDYVAGYALLALRCSSPQRRAGRAAAPRRRSS